MDFMDYEDDFADEFAADAERRIESEIEAANMLRGLASRRRRIERHKALVRAEKERLDRWLSEVVNPLEAQCETIEAALESYHRFRLLKDPRKAKTLKYPYGTLASTAAAKTKPCQIEIEDADALRAWVEEHELPVMADPKPPEVAKGKLGDVVNAGYLFGQVSIVDGRLVTAEGEIVPGVKAEERQTTFRIEIVSEPEEETDGA